ncbi:MAG: hypothetical protein K8F91_18150 [Candidatus Obscuribacterales bacterium]|nr:hypothetical protein [Candidatus Obscuribacterales bacterium]
MDASDSEIEKQAEEKSRRTRLAGIIAAVLWTTGLLVLIILPANHALIWTSDALLLLGFWPLLFVYRAGWTWLVFGILNTFIGFVLLTASFLSESDLKEAFAKLPPSQADLSGIFFATREHILSAHPSWTWMIIGIISLLYGLFRIGKTLVRSILKSRR